MRKKTVTDCAVTASFGMSVNDITVTGGAVASVVCDMVFEQIMAAFDAVAHMCVVAPILSSTEGMISGINPLAGVDLAALGALMHELEAMRAVAGLVDFDPIVRTGMHFVIGGAALFAGVVDRQTEIAEVFSGGFFPAVAACEMLGVALTADGA